MFCKRLSLRFAEEMPHHRTIIKVRKYKRFTSLPQNCHRVKKIWKIWAAFRPALSPLLATPFRSNVKTVYFFRWTATAIRIQQLHVISLSPSCMEYGFLETRVLFTKASKTIGRLYVTSVMTLQRISMWIFLE